MAISPAVSAVGRGVLDASRSRRAAYLLLVPLVAGVLVALLPSLALKLAVVVGLAGVVVALLMARRDLVLDPAWVIVLQLYIFVPVGTLLLEAEAGFSIVTASTIAFIPFVLVALIIRPETRSKLILLLPLVLYAIFAGVSTLWTPEPEHGTEKYTIWLIGSLLPAVAVLVLASGRRETSWNLILVSAVLYAIATLLLGETSQEGGDRLTFLGQNPIWAARAVLVGALVALLGPFRLVVKLAAAPILVAAAVLTLSLGPLVGMLIGLLAAALMSLVLSDRATGRRSAGWALLLIAVGTGVVVLLSGVLDPILAPLLEDPNVTSRSALLDASVPLFVSAPIFGIGMGGFLSVGLAEYPHNLFVEVAVENGIVGLVAMIGWFILAMRGAIGSPLMVGLVVGTGAFTLFSGSVTGQEEFWLFSALAVAALPGLAASTTSRAGRTAGGRDRGPATRWSGERRQAAPSVARTPGEAGRTRP